MPTAASLFASMQEGAMSALWPSNLVKLLTLESTTLPRTALLRSARLYIDISRLLPAPTTRPTVYYADTASASSAPEHAAIEVGYSATRRHICCHEAYRG